MKAGCSYRKGQAYKKVNLLLTNLGHRQISNLSSSRVMLFAHQHERMNSQLHMEQ